MSLNDAWAVSQLSSLLPLPEEELGQVVTYAATSPDLSTPEKLASHFTDLLGHSPEVLSFVEEFNRRRFPQSSVSQQQQSKKQNKHGGGASSSTSASAAAAAHGSNDPWANRKKPQPKKKEPLNKLPPPRNPYEGSSSSENIAGMFAKSQNVYMKKSDGDDYMAGIGGKKKGKQQGGGGGSGSATGTPAGGSSVNVSRSNTPQPQQQQQKQQKQAGTLTSDMLDSKKKKKTQQQQQQQKIHVTGGTAMRGQSADMSDLSSALRALEMNTNPTLASSSTDPADLKKRYCGCMALKHDLLLAAPNCLSCGKIVCIKEGLGPCTFCGAALLGKEEMDEMRTYLRAERGREKMESHNAAHRGPAVSRSPAPAYGISRSGGPGTPRKDEGGAESLSNAMAHRDKLLNFQSTGARRTKIIDEAADFETPDMGTNMWATPQERALQLRAQQKKMREVEWSQKEDWEKRVMSIDLQGKRVVKETWQMATPKFELQVDDADSDDLPDVPMPSAKSGGGGGGMYSRNPLLKGLIRPVWKGNEYQPSEGEDEEERAALAKISGWRRVQDDMADNEEVILDGGALGGSSEAEKSTEPACG